MTKIKTPVTANPRDYALAVRATVAVGTASVGLATGLAASYPIILNAAIRGTPALNIRHRLALWNAAYNAGLTAIVPLPVIASSAFIVAGITSTAYQGGKQTGRLAIASILSLGHIVLTLGLMLKTNDRLKRLHHHKGNLSEEETREAKGLIIRWNLLHLFRVLSLSAASVTGLSLLVQRPRP